MDTETLPPATQYKRRTDVERLDDLRALLLAPDRTELSYLRSALDDRTNLTQRIAPIFEERIDALKHNFPTELGSYVDKIIESKLEASQEQLLNLIFPLLGKMIRKYIAQQLTDFKDEINAQIREATSWRNWRTRLRVMFGLTTMGDVALANAKLYRIEEIYLIGQGSGLLAASYSAQNRLDRDLVAGMMTAIKSFIEDALHTSEREQLGMIEYDSYKIVMYNFYKFYFCVVISGVVSSHELQELEERAGAFAAHELPMASEDVTTERSAQLSERLREHFNLALPIETTSIALNS